MIDRNGARREIKLANNSTDHRIRMERVMLHEPRFVKAPGIYDQARTAQVAQVSIGILAGIILDSNIGEQRVSSALVGRYLVLA